MASTNFRYDHPAYLSRVNAQIQCPAGTVNTVANKFIAFANMTIKAVTGNVQVAGTNAASAITMYKNGTTSVGAFANGTQAAGTALSNGLDAELSLDAGEFIDFKRSNTNGATMVSCFSIEAVLDPGADVTA